MRKCLSISHVAILIGICFVLCSSAAQIQWTYSNALSASQLKTAQRIVAIFTKKCIGVQRYPAAIVSASVDFRVNAELYRAQEYGWQKELCITLKISNNAQMSGSFKQIAGHTLEYYIGSGRVTGILTQKYEGQIFYGMPAKADEDSMAIDDSYSIVKGM